MAPTRKTGKDNTNVAAADKQHDPGQSTAPTPQGDAAATEPSPPDAAQSAPASHVQQPPKPSSWYNTGSWRSKASPVTQIVNESISVAKGATSEASEEPSRRPSQSVSKSMRGSRKSVPLAAEPTRVHATSDAGDKSKPSGFMPQSDEKLSGTESAVETSDEVTKTPLAVKETPVAPEPAVDEDSKSAKSADAQGARQSGAWFGWWSRPDGYGSESEKAKETSKRRKIEAEEAANTPPPGTPDAQHSDADSKDVTAQPTKPGADSTTKGEGWQPEMSTTPKSSRSWFGLWSNAQNQQAAAEAQAQAQANKQPQQQPEAPDVTAPTEPVGTADAKQGLQPSKDDNKRGSVERPKSSGWAFWSADRPKDPTNPRGDDQREIGELAVADTPSQSHPEAAQFNEHRQEQPGQPKDKTKRTGSLLRSKFGRTEKVKVPPNESNAPALADTTLATPPISEVPTPADTPPQEDSDVPTPVQRGKQPHTRPNHIQPSFRDVYPPEPNPGYLERVSNYVSQTLRLQSPLTPPGHPYISPSPPRIRKAIAIGIHGFFPAPLVQKVLGQPTGTSIRFANYAAASIKSWCQERQPDATEVEIEKVALEGEGFIADRVTTLWKLLLNWLSHLRQADFILVACHSQGVPVAFMLVAKLIQLGCLSPRVRIGVCAMAGISLGPFLEYRSRLFGGSALELFDFCDSASKVSRTYAEALDVCLRHGVRATLVGSLDDQLVSLESSLYTPLSHPYVNRAVFIDGRLHAPNFLTHLVVFALKLRNLGLSDHGLLRELSAPLAGSLVGGEGHSRVYDDPAVYRLAIEFALESTEMSPSTVPAALTAASSLLANDKERARNRAAARRASLSGYPSNMANANSIRRGSLSASTTLPGIAPVIAHYEPPLSGASANPFYLPWAVRGMLEEELVRRDPTMQQELEQLVKEFEEWRPTSKVLKDVRWRLEGVRSML